MTKMDPNKMMAQLGKMQQQMEQAQQELKTAYVEHSSGGGVVTVKASGALEIVEITIKPEAIDPDDPEMLQGPAGERGQRRDRRRPAAAAAEDDERHGRPRPSWHVVLARRCPVSLAAPAVRSAWDSPRRSPRTVPG